MEKDANKKALIKLANNFYIEIIYKNTEYFVGSIKFSTSDIVPREGFGKLYGFYDKTYHFEDMDAHWAVDCFISNIIEADMDINNLIENLEKNGLCNEPILAKIHKLDWRLATTKEKGELYVAD